MASKKPWDKRRVRLRELLREIRTEAGLKQVDLAAQLGTDQSFVSRYERGERRLDLVEVEAICQACSISLSDLTRRYERSA